jgi:hypothetical protein
MKQGPLFYIARTEQDVAGPYDIVQMAGLLRKKIITAETPVRLEDEQEWTPFGEHPQYIIVLEIPANAVSMRTEALNEEAQAPDTLIPLPSAETIMKLGGAAILLAVIGGLAFLVAKSDPTTGRVLMFVGGGISAIAQVLICIRLLDEDYITLLMMVFIPLFDIYYFLSNIWEYFPYFCAKYIGIILALGASAGMAVSSLPH